MMQRGDYSSGGQDSASLMKHHIYARKPIAYQGVIPVFSSPNEYIENYQRIAHDHMAAHRKDGRNPFIEEQSWVVMEDSTRDLVKKYSGPGDRVLDVGVGLGRLLGGLPNHHKYGMDISFQYLAEAKKKGVEVCYALIEEMPYKSDVFDVIVCTDVLEHVIDFNLCVKKILSVLKPGGYLVVRVPYREDLAPYTLEGYPYYYSHLRGFDENALFLQFTRCFHCEWIEADYALFLPNRGRFRYRLPPEVVTQRMQSMALKLVKAVSKKAYEIGIRRLCHPLFINIVVRKAKEISRVLECDQGA